MEVNLNFFKKRRYMKKNLFQGKRQIMIIIIISIRTMEGSIYIYIYIYMCVRVCLCINSWHEED